MTLFSRPTVAMLACASLVACSGSDSGTGPEARPTTVSASSAVSQSATVGAAAASTPSVRVLDEEGQPLRAVSVVFTIAAGGGTVTGGERVTGTDGVATVGSWVVGTVPGENRLSATVAGLTPVTFTAIASPGAAAKLAFVTQPSTGVSKVAIAPPIEVEVQDQFGNRVTSAAAEVTLGFGANPGGATLGGTATVSAESDIARFPSLSVDKSGSGYTLVAASPGLTSVTSAPFTVNAAPPAAIRVVSGNAQSGRVGAELPAPVVVRVVDASENPIAGQTVIFVVTSGGGRVFAGTGTSNADGLVQERWTLGTTAGSGHQLEARAVSAATGEKLAAATFSATASAGPPAKATKASGDAQRGPAGAVLPLELEVLVRDSYDNPVPGLTVAWAVASGGGSVSAASSTTGADGFAHTQWTMGTGLGSQSASATVAGLPPLTFTATSVAASVSSLQLLRGDDQSATVANTLPTPLAVVLRDVYGNAVSDAVVAWAVTAGGGRVVPVQATTDASGVATAQWTLGPQAGPNEVQASVPGVSPVTFVATGLPTDATAARRWTGEQVLATYPGESRVWTSGVGDVWAGGYGVNTPGAVLHNDGAGWGRPSSASHFSGLSWFQSIWGSGPDDVYASAKYVLYHYNGTAWSTAMSVPGLSAYIQAVWGSGPNDIWVSSSCDLGLGCPASLRHITASGTVDLGETGYPYLDITGSGPDAVYILSKDLVVYRSGVRSHIAFPAGFTPAGMWAAAPDDLFLVGPGGKVFRFNGSTFTQMTTPTTAGLNAIWGSSATDVYAVGTAGTIIHFDGTTWSLETSGTTAGLTSVWGTTASAPVYVGAIGGQVLTGVR